MTLKAVAGRSIDMKTEREEVLDHFLEVVEKVKSGEIGMNRFLFFAVDAEVDSFTHSCHYHGRATEVLGLLQIAHEGLLRDIME